MRKVAVIIGSASDLTQCGQGLKMLAGAEKRGEVEIKGIYVRSQHRNTLAVQELLVKMSQEKVDALIVGAGWANHLTGCCDAFLRYCLQDAHVKVIGVAFKDKLRAHRTQAAVLSITEVPGTQVIFHDYIGEDGFIRACLLAISGGLPEITLPPTKPTMDLALTEAIKMSEEQE